MEEQEIFNKFIEKVKIESTYNKFVKVDVIYKLIDIFNIQCEKIIYPISIKNPLKIVLQFYKDYNKLYYNMILEGIKNNKIIISEDIKNSYTDNKTNITYIRLSKNDGDLFLLVHEFAHFIDKNTNPNIIPDEYNFLAEVFSFCMEKKLELWLKEEKYNNLILARRNNRIFFENKMLKDVKNQMYYENLYKEKGTISESDISINEIKSIMKYDSCNTVNYLLRYPIANIFSDYLINKHLTKSDNELYSICLNTNLYEILEDYSVHEKCKLI